MSNAINNRTRPEVSASTVAPDPPAETIELTPDQRAYQIAYHRGLADQLAELDGTEQLCDLTAELGRLEGRAQVISDAIQQQVKRDEQQST